MDYRTHEEELFERWAERARRLHDNEDITRDGLLWRGELWFDGYCQVHRPGDEAAQWDAAPLRLLVLTKELWEEDGWNIRGESGRVPSPRLENNRTAYRFFPNMELWAYGLLNIPDRKVVPFAKANRQPVLQDFYERGPIARVNCKKQPDQRAATASAMNRYLENYADLLEEQIAMYGANIILCAGGQGLMVNFLKKHLYRDLEAVNTHCLYSPSANVLVVRTYHPTYSVYTPKELYTNMIRDYQAFLKQTPQFPGEQ